MKKTDRNKLKTPILFLVFNRPDTTQKVFDRIREARPPKLYIGADGPRNDKEAIICQQVRSITEQVDWDCEVITLFREKNLGCGPAVSQAITWFFDHEEMGIILEDDCLPDLSFFHFCETMLEYYKDDMRVWHIGGANFKDTITQDKNSYYFSMFSHIWGWAGWRNRWQKYRFDIQSYHLDKSLPNYSNDIRIQKYFIKRQHQVASGKTNTWDYQYLFAMWENNGLAIVPNVNLVTNIGFGIGATNTGVSNDLNNIPLKSLNEIIHQEDVIQQRDTDVQIFEFVFWKRSRLMYKLINRIIQLR